MTERFFPQTKGPVRATSHGWQKIQRKAFLVQIHRCNALTIIVNYKLFHNKFTKFLKNCYYFVLKEIKIIQNENRPLDVRITSIRKHSGREQPSSQTPAITFGKKEGWFSCRIKRSKNENRTMENCLQAFELGSVQDMSIVVQLDFRTGAVTTLCLLFSLLWIGRSTAGNQRLLHHWMLGVRRACNLPF